MVLFGSIGRAFYLNATRVLDQSCRADKKSCNLMEVDKNRRAIALYIMGDHKEQL
jgi:hypothetical protein